ncbi:hypothetical protein NGC85_05780 [Acinetobacter sp. Z1]|uniref:hypothetical protein n=1 Tax=Acinetobacter sp. Z1 TaxID=2953738 RepID=UPI0020C96569|nr:hypothetical protein [Acinetobacter sp. Z1]UTO20590.1 hypothetical protein NGC85_05780 [Acinetobacter sp. Z1]
MSDLLIKLIEVLLGRKDKFKKAEDRFLRRKEYFKDVKEIQDDLTTSDEVKRALLNSAAQKLTGSPRSTYELVNYYFNHKRYVNFEAVAPSVWFWEESVSKVYDENNELIKVEINQNGFKKERRNLRISFYFLFFATIYFLIFGNLMANYIAKNFYISNQITGLVLICFLLFLFIATVIVGILKLSHQDLPKLVE